ncbi:MerR family transcriptional regulator [Dinghuibacter silviterrae]|uniref:DNA-binding transcriptional MerR regulator n=1 Tax=Dinghuibacter silviterrae TaxID=1539049 RepID=A0A4R8DHJ8_9BACT|nr:MerR family transcriptional regulator [Dinghuibacter silviterrae]TDW96586.1 DNA-binding transcriptional MerR regulator [Dinghuibacter silviterrae]
MRIGELSRKSGFSKDTIRFYEKKGLIRLEDRTRNRFAFKDYPESVLRRLCAIRQIKEYGFTLQETLGIITLMEEGVMQPERGIRYVQRKIARIDETIRQLVATRTKLASIVSEDAAGRCVIGDIMEGCL